MVSKRIFLFLFDVDGTLTPSRQRVTNEMSSFLTNLKEKVYVGFVGGSDLVKQKEQLGDEVMGVFDYWFPENGLHYFKNAEEISRKKYLDHVSEEDHQRLINRLMEEMSKITLPVKRGNFIELRQSMINVSPVGRSCSPKERHGFFEYDQEHKIRENLVKKLENEFSTLRFSIGGEISIDIFPKGWDKTFCLNHLKDEDIERIFFFGDMTHEGGNDYEISQHNSVISTTVSSPEDTIKKVNEKLKELNI
ncbi:phosphomannomutase [Nematocida sp. LUAm3]|nr:phosphomannomutase [Nematocida sp. LUAm3]KAI5173726.1 phosphomannomutase [Nematocida sp. LUAm2]KAI5176948.1 phosphomannomutase [Nematocida sp. LUAm1]